MLNWADDRVRRPGSRLVAALALSAVIGCAGSYKKGSLEPPEIIYQDALRLMAKGKYYKVRSALQEALPRIPPEDRELLPMVQLTLADAFFLDGGLLNYGEALNSYRSFLTFFPTHPKADYVQYMVGMSLFEQVLAPDRDQTITKRAIGELNKVEALYPFSDYVLEARKAIQSCLDQLAEHERVIGWFYQRREAWEAAIDRYRNLIAAFPQASNMNRVLLDLATCLLKIDQRTEAADLLDRLNREDTEGKLAERGQRRLREYDEEQAKLRKKMGGGS
ncbi:MAG TPA: outer membrane protein assembly factor BamD [Candidatus Polarisedimenticolia bacterium]|nr:outer membrane protein assembly factor BamD [Candidatus Polarisedimenticolia bacterium]